MLLLSVRRRVDDEIPLELRSFEVLALVLGVVAVVVPCGWDPAVAGRDDDTGVVVVVVDRWGTACLVVVVLLSDADAATDNNWCCSLVFLGTKT